jgi:hypothetical protein
MQIYNEKIFDLLRDKGKENALPLREIGENSLSLSLTLPLSLTLSLSHTPSLSFTLSLSHTLLLSLSLHIDRG